MGYRFLSKQCLYKLSIQTNKKVLQMIVGHVSRLRNPEGVALQAGCHLGANVKWESGTHLSCSWGEERPISLRIRLFDALMKCWNLAKRDRYNSSRLIVLDAYLCQPSVTCTRVGPENTHANGRNLRLFNLFVTTGKRRKKRCNRRRRRKMAYQRRRIKPLAGRTTKGGDSARRMAGCGSEPGGGGKSP